MSIHHMPIVSCVFCEWNTIYYIDCLKRHNMTFRYNTVCIALCLCPSYKNILTQKQTQRMWFVYFPNMRKA